jgi:hypothetical protein
VVLNSASPARRSVPWGLRLQEWWERPVASRPERRGRRQRLVRQAAARRVARAVWSVQLPGRPHSEALSVRRDAAVAPSSCFRQVEGQPSAVLSEPAWWQAPAAV